jgi:hypothetical protein
MSFNFIMPQQATRPAAIVRAHSQYPNPEAVARKAVWDNIIFREPDKAILQ